MTLSSVSNAGLPKSNISQQKNSADTEQVEKKKDSSPQGSIVSGQTIKDDVTLNQVERSNGSTRELDAKQAKDLLPRTMKSILANGRTAVAAQANTSAQTAQEILSSN